jgi:hypothetical protein
MLIKQKSLVVAIASSLIILLVLVLTLVGYLAYLQLSEENIRRSYQDLLKKVNAKAYARHIEVQKLEARIEDTGALKGKPTVSGMIKNAGVKNITQLLVKVKFLDRDGATIYEAVFPPQEPSLGTAGFSQVTIPYIYTPPRVILKAGDSLSFKRVMASCPREILMALRETGGSGKSSGRWSGKLLCEAVSIDF